MCCLLTNIMLPHADSLPGMKKITHSSFDDWIGFKILIEIPIVWLNRFLNLRGNNVTICEKRSYVSDRK